VARGLDQPAIGLERLFHGDQVSIEPADLPRRQRTRDKD
jgi:hypothetical protein